MSNIFHSFLSSWALLHLFITCIWVCTWAQGHARGSENMFGSWPSFQHMGCSSGVERQGKLLYPQSLLTSPLPLLVVSVNPKDTMSFSFPMSLSLTKTFSACVTYCLSSSKSLPSSMPQLNSSAVPISSPTTSCFRHPQPCQQKCCGLRCSFYFPPSPLWTPCCSGAKAHCLLARASLLKDLVKCY